MKQIYKDALLSGRKECKPELTLNKTSRKAQMEWEASHNLVTDDYEAIHAYGAETGKMIGRTIDTIRANVVEAGASYAQQFMLKKRLQVFGEEGETTAKSDLLQQYQHSCFIPIDPSTLTKKKRKCTMISLMLLIQKTNGNVKG